MARVRNASRDCGSESVDKSTISDDGSGGRPNLRLTSMVPGGASWVMLYGGIGV